MNKRRTIFPSDVKWSTKYTHIFQINFLPQKT